MRPGRKPFRSAAAAADKALPVCRSLCLYILLGIARQDAQIVRLRCVQEEKGCCAAQPMNPSDAAIVGSSFSWQSIDIDVNTSDLLD